MDKPLQTILYAPPANRNASSVGVGWNPKGLCIDCGLRTACSFVRQEGGVWHCEEYR